VNSYLGSLPSPAGRPILSWYTTPRTCQSAVYDRPRSYEP